MAIRAFPKRAGGSPDFVAATILVAVQGVHLLPPGYTPAKMADATPKTLMLARAFSVSYALRAP